MKLWVSWKRDWLTLKGDKGSGIADRQNDLAGPDKCYLQSIRYPRSAIAFFNENSSD